MSIKNTENSKQEQKIFRMAPLVVDISHIELEIFQKKQYFLFNEWYTQLSPTFETPKALKAMPTHECFL